ncbi:MAG: DUF721 domain-containing protein [Planctomycetota bacterium]
MSQPDDPLDDLHRRHGSYRKWWLKKREPKPVDQVVAQLLQRKGYAEVRQAGEVEAAWSEAIGPDFAPVTAVGRLRRGALEVIAADSLTMQELTFQKEELLAQMQTALPDAGITSLRFRVGTVR